MSHQLKRSWLALLVLAIAMSATLTLWQVAVDEESQLLSVRFDANIQGIHRALEARMRAHEQVLRGGTGLFGSLGTVSRQQWSAYVEQLELDSNYPGIQGLGFAQYVSQGEKDAFLQKIRTQNLPDYAIRPEGQRAIYGPVTYLEPRNERNLKALGFDMLSEPNRQAAMLSARDTGLPAITGRLKLVSEASTSPFFGFLMYLPVFRPGLPTLTAEQRQQALLGFVNSPIRLEKLLLGMLNRQSDTIHLKIYDDNAMTDGALMFDDQAGKNSQPTPAADLQASKSLTKIVSMKMFNREWALEFSTPQQHWTHANAIAWVVLAGGSTISLLLAALAYFLTARIRMIKNSERHYFELANFDSLTGLPNRSMFHDRLERNLLQSEREQLTLALLFLDIDNFKDINDTFGHHVGDDLLKEVASRLQSCVRKYDTLARLGGDEFTIILYDLQSSENAGKIAQSIIDKMAAPFALPDGLHYISASIGITLYPTDHHNAAELLKNADQAMYSAKQRGRNQFQYFENEMQIAVQSRMQILGDLRSALPQNELFIVYQPIIDLSNGQICKAEALIRWQNPRLGLVSPADFIPVAEEFGLISSIGDWVLRQAATQVLHWKNTYRSDFQISVNVSPAQFRRPDAGQISWIEFLQSFDELGQSLVVEITEGLLLDTDRAVLQQMLALRDAGIQVALDDFGTGYSSLSYLKKFDIDYLKIDQSFVSALAPDSDDLALCSAIIVMAHRLGLKVVAEGIETQTQCDLLIEAGCDYGQGYLFSKPVPPSEFEILLQKKPSLDIHHDPRTR